MSTNPSSIASKLIKFSSITPNSAGSVEFLVDLFTREGFTCIQKDFGLDGEKVLNLYAKFGNNGPNICFVGHLDVVPPGELKAWEKDPFSGDIEDGVLFGRGAVDMKGAIGAAISAAIDFKNSKKNNCSVSFLLTTDEEGVARYGIREMLPWMQENGHKIDFAVIGEPTTTKNVGESIAIGRRGSINFILTIKGKQGHVAYPESFVNPINIAMDVASHLSNIKLDDGNKDFMPSSLNITSFDVGNLVTNVVPDSVLIRFNIRFNDNFNEVSILNKIKSIISEKTENFTLEWDCPGLPFLSRKDPLIPKFAESSKAITGLDPNFITTGATSDARFVIHYCACIEFGLQHGRAHQVNEQVKTSDIETLKEIYLTFLREI